MPSETPDSFRSTRPRVRWWPLVLVLSGAAVAFVWIRTQDAGDAQAANLDSAKVVLLAGVLTFAWLVTLSRLSARARLRWTAAVAALVVGFFAAVRVRGVTGDLVPVLEWRWTQSTVVHDAAAHRPAGSEVALEGLADWPQFLGPTRDCRLPGPRLVDDWDAEPPELLWRRNVGEGWSGFAVAGRRAVTQEQRGDDEAIVCYDVGTGDELWARRAPARHTSSLGGLGPRSTPTLVDGRVFALGATGLLRCLELATGELVWTEDVLADNDAASPQWGVAGSPLVLGDRVIVSAGGADGRSLVAYSASDGARLWRGGDDRIGYSSPVHATLAGVEQVLIFNARSIAAHAPDSGTVLWSFPWPAGHPHVCAPLIVGDDSVLVSSGYGTGAALLKIRAEPAATLTATRAWRSLRLKAKFTNVVTMDGYVYGLDDGIMTCLDPTTGARQWKGGRYGHGQVILVGDLLLVSTETGEVVLLEPTPEEHRELTQFQAFDGKWWNPPALAGRYLIVRTDREAACFRLPVRDE